MLKGTGGGGGGKDTKSFRIVLTRDLEVLAILIGGRKKFPPFKRRREGGEKFDPVLTGDGGGQKVFFCIYRRWQD